MAFIKRISPLVSLIDYIYHVFTIRDTRETLTVLSALTYAIIYQETVMRLAPLLPILVILFIFHNYYYEVKFERPKTTYVRNMKLVQAIMTFTGDSIEVQYYVLENFFYWKNKESTLFTLNACLLGVLGLVPLWLIPLRYFIVLGIWGGVGAQSPFFMAIARSLLELALEYGIILETFLPSYMNDLHYRVEFVYIPRLVRVWRWLPLLNRLIPHFFMSRYELARHLEEENLERASTVNDEHLKNPYRNYVQEGDQMLTQSRYEAFQKEGEDSRSEEQENLNIKYVDHDMLYQEEGERQAFLKHYPGEELDSQQDRGQNDQAFRTDSVYKLEEFEGQNHGFQRGQLMKFETYENQRVWMGIFKSVLMPYERPAWSDRDGKIKLPKESILLPVEGNWVWESDWHVEINPSFHDKKGWHYAQDFNGPFKKQRRLFDLVRRRRWVRYATLVERAEGQVSRDSLRATTISSHIEPQYFGNQKADEAQTDQSSHNQSTTRSSKVKK
mmetsp:Transcript_7459/g.12609  ORF Transcript_7459/g.12609 Transcript_7459/m.12609 type:complete len:500 (-) Transcript_7459:99-1598(-)